MNGNNDPMSREIVNPDVLTIN